MASAWIEISGKMVGEITIDEKRGISLSKELGFYRLKITANIKINPSKEINQILSDGLTSPVIFGDIRLNLTLNNTKNIGCGFPEKSVWLKSNENMPNSREFCFFVDLDQKTIDAIEEIRAGIKDLMIICKPEGVLFSEDVCSPRISNDLICRELRIEISQSDWCKILTACGYCETILIEVKILAEPNSPFYEITKEFKGLNEMSLSGNHKITVGECRGILENIEKKYTELNPEIKNEVKKENDNAKLSKEARIYNYYRTLYNPLSNIFNLAHHTSETEWNRRDVKMVIGNTALLLQWLDDSQD